MIFFNKHWIRTNSDGHIIQGWSDGSQPNISLDNAILLTDQGGYQFRLFPGREENPRLFNEFRVPLYSWDGTQVILRNSEDVEADRPAPLPPMPSQEERIRDLEGFLTGIKEGFNEHI